MSGQEESQCNRCCLVRLRLLLYCYYISFWRLDASEKRLLLTDPDVVQSLQNELHALRSKVQQLESSQNSAVSENAALKSKLTRLEDELANLRHNGVPGM